VNWSGEDDWGMWMRMGNISALFKMNGSISGIRLTEVYAIPNDLRLSLTKERINESGYWNASVKPDKRCSRTS